MKTMVLPASGESAVVALAASRDGEVFFQLGERVEIVLFGEEGGEVGGDGGADAGDGAEFQARVRADAVAASMLLRQLA